MAVIPVEKLAETIQHELTEFSKEVTDKVIKAVDKVTLDARKELNASSPKDSGTYARNWSKKTVEKTGKGKHIAVHNKKNWNLTHLLEYGHASRNGGRVAAKSHIDQIAQKTVEQFEKAVEKAITG